MATLLLTRHGRTEANAKGVLVGRTPGVWLDDEGRTQAKALAARLASLPLAAVVTSPLERCRETAQTIAAERSGPEPVVDERLVEVAYGEWQGKELKALAKDPLWKVVQANPSAVTFPSGEALVSVSARAVGAVRDWDQTVEAEHGPDALWVAVSHGDVIKSVLADALGLHLDQFQRLLVDPCSVSVIRYEPLRPFVVRVNDTGSDLSSLVPRRRRRRRARNRRRDSDAAVGGGTGASADRAEMRDRTGRTPDRDASENPPSASESGGLDGPRDG